MMSNNRVIGDRLESFLSALKDQNKLRNILRTPLVPLKSLSERRELLEYFDQNGDETQFVFDIDNSRTFGLKGNEHLKYADVVSGD